MCIAILLQEMFSAKTKSLQSQSKAHFQQYCHDNQICELIRAILQPTDTHNNSSFGSSQTNPHRHTLTRSHTLTHTVTQSTSTQFKLAFLNVNNMSPAPPNLEERQTERERECVNDKQAVHNILLYRSICIHLIAFVSVHFEINPLLTPRLISSP